MLDPDLVLAAVVTATQSIPELVTSLGGDPAVIVGHQYAYGVESSLSLALFQMRSPSILIAYLDLIGGNFSGQAMWKHRLEYYIQPMNGGDSPPHLWWLIMNKAATALPPGTLPIRKTSLLSGALMLEDLPTLRHHQAEDGRDFFCGTCVFTEYGDND